MMMDKESKANKKVMKDFKGDDPTGSQLERASKAALKNPRSK